MDFFSKPRRPRAEQAAELRAELERIWQDEKCRHPSHVTLWQAYNERGKREWDNLYHAKGRKCYQKATKRIRAWLFGG